eukprot:4964986-Pleurochrysis_carterae.AAC.3
MRLQSSRARANVPHGVERSSLVHLRNARGCRTREREMACELLGILLHGGAVRWGLRFFFHGVPMESLAHWAPYSPTLGYREKVLHLVGRDGVDRSVLPRSLNICVQLYGLFVFND